MVQIRDKIDDFVIAVCTRIIGRVGSSWQVLGIGTWCLGKCFKEIDIYAPDEKVKGITFSNDKKYIEYISKYENARRTKKRS